MCKARVSTGVKLNASPARFAFTTRRSATRRDFVFVVRRVISTAEYFTAPVAINGIYVWTKSLTQQVALDALCEYILYLHINIISNANSSIIPR